LTSPENPQFAQQVPLSTDPQPSIALGPDPLLPDSLPAAPSVLTPAPAPPPPRDPVWSGWDVLLITVVAVLSLIVMQVLVLVGAKELIYPHWRWNDAVQKLAHNALLAIVAQFLTYIPLAICMVALVKEKYDAPFWPAIHWNWPRSQWKMLGLGALVLLSLNLLGHFLPMPQSTPFEELFSRPRDAYLMSMFAITLGPLMEELFFRGFLYPVLARRMGIAWGIFFTALPFGLIHMFQYGYAWGVVLLIFLMGVVCTVVRAATGSVASSFLVHVGYNATEMLLFAIATDGFRHMEKAGVLWPI
jgi:membrane protease YdiL (CAAX protease family)